jgi:hypothetical protein
MLSSMMTTSLMPTTMRMTIIKPRWMVEGIF